MIITIKKIFSLFFFFSPTAPIKTNSNVVSNFHVHYFYCTYFPSIFYFIYFLFFIFLVFCLAGRAILLSHAHQLIICRLRWEEGKKGGGVEKMVRLEG